MAQACMDATAHKHTDLVLRGIVQECIHATSCAGTTPHMCASADLLPCVAAQLLVQILGFIAQDVLCSLLIWSDLVSCGMRLCRIKLLSSMNRSLRLLKVANTRNLLKTGCIPPGREMLCRSASALTACTVAYHTSTKVCEPEYDTMICHTLAH